MADNEKTSAKIAALASKAMRDPKSLTPAEIKSLGASALTQTADKPKKKPAARKVPKPRTKKKP